MLIIRGALILEALLALGLLFLTAFMTMGMLSSSDRAYAQATQTRVALRLAREGLENMRAGNIAPAAGVQTLATVALRQGSVPMAFIPELESLLQGNIWLVRSRVRWSEGPRTHMVELKTYFAR